MVIIAYSKNSIHVWFLSSPSFLTPAIFWNRVDVCDVDLILCLLWYVRVMPWAQQDSLTNWYLILTPKLSENPRAKNQQEGRNDLQVPSFSTSPPAHHLVVHELFAVRICHSLALLSHPLHVRLLWPHFAHDEVSLEPKMWNIYRDLFWKHAVESVSYWDWFNTSLNLECEILITTQMKKGSSLAKKKVISCIISIVRMNMMPNIHYL